MDRICGSYVNFSYNIADKSPKSRAHTSRHSIKIPNWKLAFTPLTISWPKSINFDQNMLINPKCKRKKKWKDTASSFHYIVYSITCNDVRRGYTYRDNYSIIGLWTYKFPLHKSHYQNSKTKLHSSFLLCVFLYENKQISLQHLKLNAFRY